MPKVPDQGEKDKTITRRTVKGAAGGMAGVDYVDERRVDPSTGARATSAALSSKAAALVREVRGAQQLERATDLDRSKNVVNTDPDYIIIDDDDAETREHKKKKKKHVGRDRLSIDKDAPELKRAKKWIADEEDDEEERPEQERELEVTDEVRAIAAPRSRSFTRTQRFGEEKRPEPGDLTLTDPDEIARALGSPLLYARHAMILAEAFRRTTGATRAEAIDYLARMFLAVTDHDFGRSALKEFGPASGIIDVYPLEVIEHLLDNYPGFLPKVAFGSLFANQPSLETETIRADTRKPVLLDHSPDLKIRSFALSGGGRPGYLFEPDEEQLGRYRLHIYSSGKYRVLIGAIDKEGRTTIDRLRIHVRPRAVEDFGIAGDATYYPERSEADVRAWPIPRIQNERNDLNPDDAAALFEAVLEAMDEVDDTLTEVQALED